MIEEERAPVTYAQALELLPDSERIHTYRAAGGIAIGASWPRQELLEHIKSYGAELSGAHMTGLGYRLVIIDQIGALFIATKEQQ